MRQMSLKTTGFLDRCLFFSLPICFISTDVCEFAPMLMKNWPWNVFGIQWSVIVWSEPHLVFSSFSLCDDRRYGMALAFVLGMGHFGVLWWFYSEFNEISLLTNDLRRSLFLVSCFKWHSTKKTFDRANLGQSVILTIPSIFAKRRQSNDYPENIKYQAPSPRLAWTAD